MTNPTNVNVTAEAPSHIAVVGQAVSSVERSLDGRTVTIVMNSGDRYTFKFRTIEEGAAFYERVIQFLSNVTAVQDVLSISVDAYPQSGEDDGKEHQQNATAEQSEQTPSRILI
ncbi:hypothetical protein [Stenotrophomonas lactitubi]|uniref:hypothetical protein n=1 Tax=Stenotrophomonas lactitubi TaxID=2045214 RepID=UPI00203F8349|nr:hypothetical protein [Stenotrophomonas lactitubi]